MPLYRPFTFKGGRRKPDPEHAKRSIKLEDILRLPPLPPEVDYTPMVSSYPMDGNADYGDCVSASIGHEIQLVTKALAAAEYDPPLSEIYQFYATQNPGFDPNNYDPSTDNGMDMQTAFEELNKNGWPGHPEMKLVAFAKVQTTPAALKAAAGIFGAAQLGIIVQAANENQFNAGQPWDYVSGSPELGGHCIPTFGYKSDRSMVVTWAQETALLDTFTQSPLMEEAWVLIWPWHLGTKAFQANIDVNALAAAYQELTGNPLPIPTPPAPTPTPPPPTPVPTPPPPAPTPGPGCLSIIQQILFGK